MTNPDRPAHPDRTTWDLLTETSPLSVTPAAAPEQAERARLAIRWHRYADEGERRRIEARLAREHENEYRRGMESRAIQVERPAAPATPMWDLARRVLEAVRLRAEYQLPPSRHLESLGHPTAEGPITGHAREVLEYVIQETHQDVERIKAARRAEREREREAQVQEAAT